MFIFIWHCLSLINIQLSSILYRQSQNFIRTKWNVSRNNHSSKNHLCVTIAIDHRTSIMIEMIENSHYVMSNNLAQTIEIFVNYHSKNTEIKNITKVKIISMINQRVITINHWTIQRIETIDIRNNVLFLKSNSMIKRISSRHIT